MLTALTIFFPKLHKIFMRWWRSRSLWAWKPEDEAREPEPWWGKKILEFSIALCSETPVRVPEHDVTEMFKQYADSIPIYRLFLKYIMSKADV